MKTKWLVIVLQCYLPLFLFLVVFSVSFFLLLLHLLCLLYFLSFPLSSFLFYFSTVTTPSTTTNFPGDGTYFAYTPWESSSYGNLLLAVGIPPNTEIPFYYKFIDFVKYAQLCN